VGFDLAARADTPGTGFAKENCQTSNTGLS
jgi:hypothetical protein